MYPPMVTTSIPLDPPPIAQDQLYSLAETLQRIPIGLSTLHRYIRSGAIRSVKVGGRRFITESAVQAFLTEATGPAPYTPCR